ncbi:MAG: alpha/beta hydrolase [Streptococcus gallolyticus]|nr:alpha/beta hydrolase [Streptococcus gallolyticus]
MENIFTVSLPNGRTQKGRIFECENAKMNLLILTGMGEHAMRYEEFAKYLNELGINVRVLDAVGQGLNAPKVEDQEKWYEGAFDDNVTAAALAIDEFKKNELPTSIMGHSMGSFMVQRYLELYPNTVNKAVI